MAAAALRICSPSSRRRAASSASSPVLATSAAAVATAAGTSSGPLTRGSPRSSSGPGRSQRVPGRTTSRPAPDGPPNLWALAVSRSQSHSRTSTGSWPMLWAASTCSAAPAARHRWATSATGWRVAISWLADCTLTRAVCGPGLQSVHHDPAGGFNREQRQPTAGSLVSRAGVQHAGVLDRRNDQLGGVPAGGPERRRRWPAGRLPYRCW